MATASFEPVQSNEKRLPTNWIAPKKPAYRGSILDHSEVKAVLLSHNTQPYLNRNEKEKFKNSFKKQICIEMLRQGFHKSFREIDFILKLQIEDRHRVGPEHPVWDRPLLDQEPNKLEYLSKKLNKAETAESFGKFRDIYANYYDLANYFLLADDTWLSDYFFEKCLNLNLNKLAKLEPQNLAEAYCNLGLAFERRNSYYLAMEHFQEYYNLTKDTNYTKNIKFEDLSHDDIAKLKQINKINIEDFLKNIDNDKLFIDACIHLQRIYKIIANKYATNIEEKISYLTKAYDVCKSSSIGILEGQTSYLLGNIYIENSNLDISLSYFNNYYEISKRGKDLENLGKASEALAKCYEKMGQVEKSIEYLKKYLQEVSDKEADRQYSRACTSLANIYNKLGQYDLAVEYSKKAFDISRQMNHRDVIDFNRVLVGISKAHNNLAHFNKNVELGTRKNINNLIKWKYEMNGDKILRQTVSENDNDD